MIEPGLEARCDELGVASRVAQAAEALSLQIRSGVGLRPLTLCLLSRLERFAAREGRASAGARAAVRLIAQATAQHPSELRPVLHPMVRFATGPLSDCEESVREAFVGALASALREHLPTMTTEEARTLCIVPLLRSIHSHSRGGALALRAVLRVMPPDVLSVCEEPLAAALKRQLGADKPGVTSAPQCRAALLDCVRSVLSASESAGGMAALASIAIGCAHAADWRERLAAVSVLRSIEVLKLPAHVRSQHTAALAKLRYDPSSLVRQAVSEARSESDKRSGAPRTFEDLILQPSLSAAIQTRSPTRRSARQQVGAIGEGGVNWDAMVMACSAARWATASQPSQGSGVLAGHSMHKLQHNSAPSWREEIQKLLAAHEMAVYTGWTDTHIALQRIERRVDSLSNSVETLKSLSLVARNRTVSQKVLGTSVTQQSATALAKVAWQPVQGVSPQTPSGHSNYSPFTPVSANPAVTDGAWESPLVSNSQGRSASEVSRPSRIPAPNQRSRPKAPSNRIHKEDAGYNTSTSRQATGSKCRQAPLDDNINGSALLSRAVRIANEELQRKGLTPRVSGGRMPTNSMLHPRRREPESSSAISAAPPDGTCDEPLPRSPPMPLSAPSNRPQATAHSPPFAACSVVAEQEASTPPARKMHREPVSLRSVMRKSRLQQSSDTSIDTDAALWLAHQGRIADAFALTWRVLASDTGEGTRRVLRLLEECDPRNVFAVLPAIQSRMLVQVILSELQQERNAEALLPWLERALWLQHEGTVIFDEQQWDRASKAVRGLSASDDAIGVTAARLHAFFHPAAKRALSSSPKRDRPAWQKTHSWLD